MSQPIDYTMRYQIRSGRVNFANYVVRRAQVQNGSLLGLNLYPPDNDASIVPFIREGEENTSEAELNRYLESVPTTSQPVTIVTVPDAPTSVSGTAGNTQAVVSFTAPTNNGGSAITGYTVTSSPGGFTATGSASPLTVTGLTNGTAYTFTVVATNSIGNSVSSAPSSAVTPATVPGAPTSVSGTAGNTQVVVSFTAPASDGGSTITGYTVTSSPGGFTATGFASPLTVTGLTNGTAYTFTVIATNSIGNSASSSASSAVTPATVPGAPTSVTATAGFTQATVSFSAPASNGGSTITGYTVTSSPGGFTATGSASPLTVTGLTNGTAYTFTVVATNSIGSSVSSSPSGSITPDDAIAGSLTTSLAAYNAAANDDWVQITSTEYATLQTNISGTTKPGLADSYLSGATGTNASGLSQTSAALVTNTVTSLNLAIPANTYLYAFAFKYGANIPFVGVRVYTNTNTASTGGYNQVGGALPSTTGPGILYYVRKGVSVTNGATAGLLGCFSGTKMDYPAPFVGSSGYIGFNNYATPTPPIMRYLLGDGTVPGPNATVTGALPNYGAFQIQGLATATKQWA